MIEEATETRSVAKSTGFYPNPLDALGCEPSLFFNQYPQLYSGVAKNGAPIFISKPGVLNVDAMECCTTLEGIVKFHWYVMMHDFKIRLQAQKDKDPEQFHRYVVKTYYIYIMRASINVNPSAFLPTTIVVSYPSLTPFTPTLDTIVFASST
jgi:hypothetical protein